MIPIVSVMMVLLVLTLVIPRLFQGNSSCVTKRVVHCIFLLYTLGNLYYTLLSRTPGTVGKLELVPFQTYYRIVKSAQSAAITTRWPDALFVGAEDLIVGIILNVFLYYPMGYLLSGLVLDTSKRKIVLWGAIASGATEIIQYLLGLGWCTIDDVIHNTLGTAIGVWVWLWQSKRLKAQRSADTQ